MLAVLDPGKPGAAALERLVESSSCNCETIDIVAVSRPRKLLRSLAISAGVTWEELEAEEIAELNSCLQALVARLPKHLGVRSRVDTGSPDRVVAGLVKSSCYDVVVIADGCRLNRRGRAMVERLAPGAELIVDDALPASC
jgi:hypothetical protein